MITVLDEAEAKKRDDDIWQNLLPGSLFSYYSVFPHVGSCVGQCTPTVEHKQTYAVIVKKEGDKAQAWLLSFKARQALLDLASDLTQPLNLGAVGNLMDTLDFFQWVGLGTLNRNEIHCFNLHA